MAEEEVAGYLIRRELESGDEEFWNVDNGWVSDPGDSELYEDEDEASAKADELREQDKFVVTVEEVYFDDEEYVDEDHDDEA
ncbi:hypothetical protein D5366_11085 [Neokomagataea tanensis]|uniref:Uncharacterized protein n=2 Tax=Neokomagataea TaxID=1223423 RepID=A0A4Y6V7J9_9PROT|nr:MULTISPECIES: hypothetical protein [Neokomagataea]QDH26012.1 hypothetical protein D5366_11085 [Neokomagataea tanensis]